MLTSLNSYLPYSSEFDRQIESESGDEFGHESSVCVPGDLNMVMVSLYDEFISCFEDCARVYFAKTIGDYFTVLSEVSQIDLSRAAIRNSTGSKKNFVIKSICYPETLSMLMLVLERGHDVYVFYPWLRQGRERRSAMSILIRNIELSVGNDFESELEMWKVQLLQKVEEIQFQQSILLI